MTNYSRGRATEYERIEYFKKNGFQAIRTAGSHSPVDIIAWDRVSIYFEQLKLCKSKKFYPDRKELLKFADIPIPPEATKRFVVRYVGSKEWHEYLVLKDQSGKVNLYDPHRNKVI